jgi:hypothetical protein
VTAPSRKTIAVAQAAYYAPTAILPFLSRRAFERLTGEKTEWWLVQTVSALVGAGGATLALAAARDPGTESVVLGAGAASGLGLIDLVYVARRRIAPVYLLDAAAQLALAGAWLLAASHDGAPRRLVEGG